MKKKIDFILSIWLFFVALSVVIVLAEGKNAFPYICLYWASNSIKLGLQLLDF